MLSNICVAPGMVINHMVTCAPHGNTFCAGTVSQLAQASDPKRLRQLQRVRGELLPQDGAGITWKPDTNRITPHTDETLVTLLFTSPGALHSRLPACACACAARNANIDRL